MVVQNNKSANFDNKDDNESHIPSISIIEAKLNFTPKITIAIPTYKRPDLLKEALDSALNQTVISDYEVIIVDNNPERDCETEKLLKTYSDNRISYYKNSVNLGMVGNWNQCIELTKSDFLTILHDDDLLHPRFIEYNLTILKQNLNIQGLVCNMYHVGENVKFEDIPFDSTIKKIRTKAFLFGNITPFPGVLFKKDIKNRFDENTYPIADYDFWYKISCKGNFYLSPLKLAFYRITNQQESSSAFIEIIKATSIYHKKYLINKLNPIEFIVSNYQLKKLNDFYLNIYQGKKSIEKPVDYVSKLICRIYRKIIFI